MQEENSIEKFMAGYNQDKISLKNRPGFREIDHYDFDVDIFRALTMPEKYKNFRLPAPFSIPTYTFQQKTSFNINLNANGCAWVCINLGQYL